MSNTSPTILCGTAPGSSSLQNSTLHMLLHNEHTCRRISHLLKEESQYQCQDYLKDNDTADDTASASSSSSASDSNKSSNSYPVNAACRTRVCRWIFDTVDSLKMSHETALVAISNLDRYMSVSTKARYNRKEYQLASMTSLYIAIKVTEPVRVKTSILSRVSRGYQSEQDILRYEREMIAALGYNINGPTPFQFVGLILSLLPTMPGLQSSSDMSKKLYLAACREVELLIQDSKFVPLRRSSIAIAAIINALKKVPQAELTIDERVQFIKSVSNAFGLDVMSSLLLLGSKKKRVSKRRGGCDKTISKCSPTAEASPPQIPLCIEEERKKMKRAVSDEALEDEERPFGL